MFLATMVFHKNNIELDENKIELDENKIDLDENKIELVDMYKRILPKMRNSYK